MSMPIPVKSVGLSAAGTSMFLTAGRAFGARLAAILAAWAKRGDRRRALRRLQALDDHTLRDIGLSRDAVRGGRP